MFHGYDLRLRFLTMKDSNGKRAGMVVAHVFSQQVLTKIICETNVRAGSEFDAVDPLPVWDSRTECQILQRLHGESGVKLRTCHTISHERNSGKEKSYKPVFWMKISIEVCSHRWKRNSTRRNSKFWNFK